MEAAIFNCKCDQMQNCEGSLRNHLSVYFSVPLGLLAEHIPAPAVARCAPGLQLDRQPQPVEAEAGGQHVGPHLGPRRLLSQREEGQLPRRHGPEPPPLLARQRPRLVRLQVSRRDVIMALYDWYFVTSSSRMNGPM